MLSDWVMIGRLLCAAALGGMVGFERERLLWAAGLRTVRIRPAPQFRVAREVSPAERVCAASGRLSQGCGSSVGLPIPGQQFVEVLGRVIGQPSEHVGQPSLGIDIVEFGSLN